MVLQRALLGILLRKLRVCLIILLGRRSGGEDVLPCRIDSEFLCGLVKTGGGGEINIL